MFLSIVNFAAIATKRRACVYDDLINYHYGYNLAKHISYLNEFLGHLAGVKWPNNTCKLKPISEARAFMKDLCAFHDLLTEMVNRKDFSSTFIMRQCF